MSKVLKAITYSAFGQYSVHIIGFALVIILARLLTPAEIGVFAVAGSVTLLATELRAMGVAQYIIREKDLNEKKIRAALGLTTVVSWVLGMILIVSAPWIAEFYNQPALIEILFILSISFFIGPFSSVPYALWMRGMQFKNRFYQQLIGSVIHSVLAILLVLMGFSYYGLAIAAVAGVMAELAVAIILRPVGTVWIPSFSWMRDLVKFGLYTSATNLFSRFSLSIPDLVIGRLATMTDVGMFSRGMGVIQFAGKLLFSAFSPVILPYLSEVNRSEKSVADAYLQAIKLQAALSWPILAVISIAAFPLIRVMFGDQWDHAAPITSILALSLIIASTHYYANAALLAKGAENIVLLVAFVTFVVRLVGVVIAMPYGLEMAAWAIVFSSIVDLVMRTIVLRKTIGLKVRRLILELFPNMLITFACWYVSFLIDQIMSFDQSNVWISILVLAICLPPTWLILLRITKHELWKLISSYVAKVMEKYTALKG